MYQENAYTFHKIPIRSTNLMCKMIYITFSRKEIAPYARSNNRHKQRNAFLRDAV